MGYVLSWVLHNDGNGYLFYVPRIWISYRDFHVGRSGLLPILLRRVGNLPIRHNEGDVHGVSYVSRGTVRLYRTIYSDICAILLCRIQFHRSLYFPTLPSYLPTNCSLAYCFCRQFPTLLVPFLVKVTVDATEAIVAVSFKVGTIGRCATVTKVLVRPPAGYRYEPPVISAVEDPVDTGAVRVTEFFILFSIFKQVPRDRIVVNRTRVCPPMAPAVLLVPPRGLTGVKEPVTPGEAWADITMIPDLRPDATPADTAPGA